MHASFTYLSVLFNLGVSFRLIALDYPPTKMYWLIYGLEEVNDYAVRRLDAATRENICKQVLSLDYFLNKGIQYVDKNRLHYRDKLSKERSPSFELHYTLTDTTNDYAGAIYLATDDVVNFGNAENRVAKFPCLGEQRDNRGKRLVDVFISSGYRADLYLTYVRDPERNIIPAGLVTTQPEICDYTDQQQLELAYVHQRNKGTQDGPIIQKLRITQTQIHALVFIIFKTLLANQSLIKFRDQPDDIDYSPTQRPLTFETEELRNTITNWAVDVIPVKTYKFMMIPEENPIKMFYVGQSHDGLRSVFIFEDTTDSQKVRLRKRITSLSILEGKDNLVEDTEPLDNDFTFPILASPTSD